MNNKIERGQFFTKRNIFNLNPFKNWWNIIPLKSKNKILEPFAGANNIISLLKEVNILNEYSSFDIEPKEKTVIERNTFIDFPKGFDCVITNPPYLSKNSATKKKINLNFGIYFDLYEVALNKCLENSKYVAAIIPESFITTNRLKDRLHTVISLTYDDMFSDTSHPVCLALFVPENTNDYYIYKNDDLLGKYSDLKAISSELLNLKNKKDVNVKFNVLAGSIDLLAVDNHLDNTGIYFSYKKIIKKEEIKETSRAKTRIELSIDGELITDNVLLKKIVNNANNLLIEYRNKTFDTFMTSFKGLRKDQFYRRRLDFDTAKKILIKAVEKTNLN